MIQIHNPYQDIHSQGQWYRGNLHSHTKKSDGSRPEQEVIDDYAGHGYDFLMISDHDIFMSEQDYKAFDSKGMILVPGNEVTKNGPHTLHVDADRRIEPLSQRQLVFE